MRKSRLSIVSGPEKANAEVESGVFEDEYALAGTQAFNLYGASGKRLGRWEAVAGVTDEEFLDAMEALLARTEPHRPLRLG